MKSPTRLRPSSWPVNGTACRNASVAMATIGSSTASFIPLSSRSATRAVGGSSGTRSTLRSNTGSVDASAAPRIAAAGAGT